MDSFHREHGAATYQASNKKPALIFLNSRPKDAYIALFSNQTPAHNVPSRLKEATSKIVVAVGRNTCSRMFVTVVNLCALVENADHCRRLQNLGSASSKAVLLLWRGAN